MAYLYRHIRLDKNEPFYIGIGSDEDFLYTRAYGGLYGRKIRNPHWYNIINKTQYEVEIMEDGLSWNEACEKEIYFIRLYGRSDLGQGSLVNQTNGGDGRFGVLVSDKTKEKQRRSRALFLADNPHPKKGMVVSEEERERLRIIATGRKGLLNATSRPIIQVSVDGVVVAKYDNARRAQEATGVCFKLISLCAHGKTMTAKGFVWLFESSFSEAEVKERIRRSARNGFCHKGRMKSKQPQMK